MSRAASFLALEGKSLFKKPPFEWTISQGKGCRRTDRRVKTTLLKSSVIEQEATKTGKRDGQPTERVMPCISESQQHNSLHVIFHLYVHFITKLVLNIIIVQNWITHLIKTINPAIQIIEETLEIQNGRT